MSRSRGGIGSGALAALVAALLAAGAHRPASAQGGLLCDVGPADYRRCCKESYRRNPELGLRARAEDIDACMKGSSPEVPSVGRSDGERDRGGEATPAEAPPSAVPSPAPAPDPPVVLRNTGASPIRRITCATEPCDKGCGGDEMAISAFCKIGSFPTLTQDGAVRCATRSGTELPIVLFCARR